MEVDTTALLFKVARALGQKLFLRFLKAAQDGSQQEWALHCLSAVALNEQFALIMFSMRNFMGLF